MEYVKTIVYKPVRCPYCGSKRNHITAKKNPSTVGGEVIRYHHCKPCDRTFRSVEED